MMVSEEPAPSVRVPRGRGLAATLLSLALHGGLLGGLALAPLRVDPPTVTVELVTPPPVETPAREPEVMEPTPRRPPPPPPGSRRERPAAVEAPPPIPAPAREPAIVVAPPVTEPPAARRAADAERPIEPARPAAPPGPSAESVPGSISALPSGLAALPAGPAGPDRASMARPPAAPAVTALPSPSGRDGFSGPRVDRQRPPRYPDAARHEGAEGIVLVKALVQGDGAIGAVEVERSSGHAVLDRAAVQAVREWRFRPAELNGARVAAWVVVPIHFQISR